MLARRETEVPAELRSVMQESPKKHNAANDNVEGGKKWATGGFVNPKDIQPIVNRDYVISRETYDRLKHRSSHLEMTPEERLPGAIKALSRLPGHIYLGSAYSKYEAGHDAASRVAADAAARLMAAGLCIFAPIPHGHTITLAGDLPKDWTFWKKQCDPMIAAASAIIVLTMHGWQESVGLQYEISEFARHGKPILHASPSDLMTLREAA